MQLFNNHELSLHKARVIKNDYKKLEQKKNIHW